MSSAEHRPDIPSTIPLAAKTLVRKVGKPRRAWLIPALTIATGIVFATLLLELIFSPGPVSALAYQGELRSRLVANYAEDPIGSRIHELRLSIVEQVFGASEPGGQDSSGGGETGLVPTVTQEPSRAPSEAATDLPTEPTPTGPVVTATEVPPELLSGTSTGVPSTTPKPSETPADAPNTGLDCRKLYFEEVQFRSDDEIRARVQNDLPKDAYLTYTVLSWPDVPAPAYVDYFRFDYDRYYNGNDHSSPTARSSWERLRDGQDELWRVDFDDEPDEGLYGHFRLELTFRVPALDGSCTISAELYQPFPPGKEPTEPPTNTPEPGPTDPPAPTATAEPTNTSVPSSTPAETSTDQPSPTPEGPPTGTPAPTVEPSDTPEPTATAS